jgi:septal ring factor EnvC (AmiA/AmiB activator)
LKEDGAVATTNILVSRRGWRVVAFIAVACLLIVWQSIRFTNAFRENLSERIDIFKRMNNVEKLLEDSRNQLHALVSQLKESDSKLDIVSQRLKFGEAKTAALEKQLDKQKAAILNIETTNKELRGRLDSISKRLR